MRKDSFIPLLCGFIVSSILTFVVIMTTWNFGVVYERRIQVFDIVISFIWLFFLLKGKGWERYSILQILAAVFFFACLGLYMVSAWHGGAITNTPLIGINMESEGMHRDFLYHNALASSIEYYGHPSLLVNSDAFHNYHFGSHLFLGLISKFMSMPTIFTYCYLYPVIFFPLFPSLVLSVAYSVRNRVKGIKDNCIVDILVLLGFMTFYTIPESLSSVIGDGKSLAWLNSESFCVAIVLSLVFFKVFVSSLNNRLFENKYYSSLFAVCIVPLFIIVIALSKISVGLIVTFIICYYLFRRKGINIRFLLLELIYVIVAFSVHYIPACFYSPILSGTNEEIFSLSFLANMKNSFDPRLWGVHILFLFMYAIIFIVYRLRNVFTFKLFISKIKSGEIIVEETLFFTCVVAALPGMFIDIGGGSAFYFYAVQRAVAVTLLLAYNIPTELLSKIGSLIKNRNSFIHKVTAVPLLLCLSCNFFVTVLSYSRILIQDCHMGPVQCVESTRENSYWDTINKINEITGDSKSDYYIYVCESASVWNKFSNPDSALFFYPAMTGIVCIGELYFEDGQLYTNNGTPKNGFYYYRPKVEDSKMTEEDAYHKAKEDGKKSIIYIHENTFSIKEIL